jgi:hypothetical protein
MADVSPLMVSSWMLSGATHPELRAALEASGVSADDVDRKLADRKECMFNDRISLVAGLARSMSQTYSQGNPLSAKMVIILSLIDHPQGASTHSRIVHEITPLPPFARMLFSMLEDECRIARTTGLSCDVRSERSPASSARMAVLQQHFSAAELLRGIPGLLIANMVYCQSKIAFDEYQKKAYGLLCQRCSFCARGHDFSGQPPLATTFKKCSRCRSALYCSAECQHADWKQHKLACAPPTTTQ